MVKNVLVIAQDLRISGTSEGIVSRSFIKRLKMIWPSTRVDVLYTRLHGVSDEKIELLNADNVQIENVNRDIPSYIKWLNKFYWRSFHESLNDAHIVNKISNIYKSLDFSKYDVIFLRSSGQDYENILAAVEFDFLKKSIVNFHDPYPAFWDPGSSSNLDMLELKKVKRMHEVVEKAGISISPSQLLSQDISVLYNQSKKPLSTIPHQFEPTAFAFSKLDAEYKKNKKYSITYHGTLQLGRDIEIIIDAFKDLLTNTLIENNFEMILRLKSVHYHKLASKYSGIENIRILKGAKSSICLSEQIYKSDVALLVENNLEYSNILPGKLPVLASSNGTVFSVCPDKSESRRIIEDDRLVANSKNKKEIQEKLSDLLLRIINNEKVKNPYADYFSLQSFENILNNLSLVF
ncbi:glycosyltransferase family protein [Nonlabens ponticola]|uniref:Glycosyltransferase family 1 protein n=1 Tax=Nonlabens ponticola TaxID=2496866 RepID=A0A3S9MXE7_9FLAO|nr:hypothetical protein [Nonlabens ponticola]AZQ43870.1 hypothetical protein EJ995_06365 [Nonlabens ponticola]